jgi:hypothetical protein
LHTQRCRFHAEGLPDSYWIGEIAFLNNYLKGSIIKSDSLRQRYNQGNNIVFQKLYDKLPLDKFHKALTNFCIYSTEIIEKFLTELERVFNALNASENYKFTDVKFEKDFAAYRNEIANSQNDKTFWQTTGLRSLVTNFNSILVIDFKSTKEFAAEQSESPEVENYQLESVYDKSLQEPCYKLIDIARVHNICVEDNEIEYVVFKDKGNFIYFDEYQRIIFDKDQNVIDTFIHNFGEIPCKFLVETNRFEGNEIEKKGLISNYIDRLDNFVMDCINEIYMTDSSAYPIHFKYAEDCTYKGKDNFQCNGGECSYNYLAANGELAIYQGKCFCKESGLIGAGSLVEVPTPQEGVTPVMMPPIGKLDVDVNALTLRYDKIEKDKNNILNLLLGGGFSLNNSQAKNEIQVQNEAEEKKAILIHVANIIETAWNFANNFCAFIRYGENFKSGFINLGNEYFLISINKLQENFLLAKERGDVANLEVIANQINYFSNKKDPQQKLRNDIINMLIPYQNCNLTDLLELKKNGVISQSVVNYQMLLPTLILEFERVYQIDLVSFITKGTEVDFKTQFDKIKVQLKQIYTDYEKENGSTQTIGIDNATAIN